MSFHIILLTNIPWFSLKKELNPSNEFAYLYESCVNTFSIELMGLVITLYVNS